MRAPPWPSASRHCLRPPSLSPIPTRLTQTRLAPTQLTQRRCGHRPGPYYPRPCLCPRRPPNLLLLPRRWLWPRRRPNSLPPRSAPPPLRPNRRNPPRGLTLSPAPGLTLALGVTLDPAPARDRVPGPVLVPGLRPTQRPRPPPRPTKTSAISVAPKGCFPPG